MATVRSQSRWRARNRLVKSQLNVMARKGTFDALDAIAASFDLRGRGEAIAFACFAIRALMRRAEHDAAAADLIREFADGYRRDRDLYAP
ncbi:MAG: hypothetical protein EA405_09965 [Rhodospirillales bacterium]|nr:MAG: hypothetical protein EA405_09965 [Rhodospirillales bacterium]